MMVSIKVCRAVVLWVAVVFALLLAVACSGDSGRDGAGASSSGRSQALRQGESLFTVNCSVCHGAAAVGTQVGPPLVHPIYNPNHHPDFAFHNAVNNGVSQHHWAFGNMPPQPGLSEGDVNNIICYIRQLQVDEGIFEGEAPC